MEMTELNKTNRNLIMCMYCNYMPELKAYFMHYTHVWEDAEDMVQELFYKLLKVDVLSEKTMRSLLFVAARRMIVDDARHKAIVRLKEKNASVQMMDMDRSFDEKIEHDHLLTIEAHFSQRIPPKRRAAYSLWREGKTIKEIAEDLNIKTRTAESHVYQAMSYMKAKLRAAL